MISRKRITLFLSCSLPMVLIGLLTITANAEMRGAAIPIPQAVPRTGDTPITNSISITLTPQVYLPLILSPQCTSYKATVYASSNAPVVSAGEQFTVTTVLVNDGCAGLGKLSYSVTIESDEDIVAQQMLSSLSAYLKPGQYDSKQFGFVITQTGQFTVTSAASFEANYGGVFEWGAAANVPFVIRVLPNQ